MTKASLFAYGTRRAGGCLLTALAVQAAALGIASSAHAQDAGHPPVAPAPASTDASPAAPAPAPAPAGQATSPASAPATAPAARPPAYGAPATPAITAAPTASVVNPARDQQDLATQGTQRPGGEMSGTPQEVFSDDWWGKARPVIEMHGYFRTRAELFHNFFLGRHSSGAIGGDGQYLFPIPLDQSYQPIKGNFVGATLCGPGQQGGTNAGQPNEACYDKTQSGANMRLRLDPEIVISDNLRVMSEIFLLDNLVLGSTSNAYAMQPGGTGPTGYTFASPGNRFAPIGLLTTTQGPPTAGINGTTNSIAVQRVWAEYMTPVGQLRFGRMPGHWGLGMVENSGDTLDSDYQTTLDRIQFVSGLPSMDLYFGGSWDFPSSGPTSATAYDIYGGQPYNTCNLCNVNQWSAFVAHRTNSEIQRLKLSRGDFVINGGVYATFRNQEIDVQDSTTPYTLDTAATNLGLQTRQAWVFTPDLWFQLLWGKLRFELEAATMNGNIGGSNLNQSDTLAPVGIRQYGLVTQTEFKAIEDKLDLQFGFGWASGDPYATNNGVNGALSPAGGGVLQRELHTPGDQVADISTFRFHPDYRIDLIFYRHILQQIEGSYYFRPSVDYDFLRHPDGEKLGGGAAVIWSRASEFIQSPGHKRDLGVELDARLYYQSKDGSLNDDPNKVGGFFAMLQYGVFFPLGGLSYLPSQTAAATAVPDASTSAAQTIRLFLGVAF
jgi:uncharacterized protein (TIGR04551 family)